MNVKRKSAKALPVKKNARSEKSVVANFQNKQEAKLDDKKLATPKGKQVGLLMVAEMTALIFGVLRDNPQAMASPAQLALSGYKLLVDHQNVDRIRIFNPSLWQKSLNEGINFASITVAMEAMSKTRDKSIEGKVKYLYSHFRFGLYDLAIADNPLFEEKKNPTTQQNTQLMQMVWDGLRNDPDVSAEIKRQSQARTLTQWKREQRNGAISAYHKFFKKFETSYHKIREQIQREVQADWPNISLS